MSEQNNSTSSVINLAVESVMDLIDALGLFATITRGALGTEEGLCCEVAPSSVDEMYMDKNQYINLDLTINGKHKNMLTLSDDMNLIHQDLTMLREYPEGDGWKIVDIRTITLPQMIGREANNVWIMASSLSVRVFTDLPYTPETKGE